MSSQVRGKIDGWCADINTYKQAMVNERNGWMCQKLTCTVRFAISLYLGVGWHVLVV